VPNVATIFRPEQFFDYDPTQAQEHDRDPNGCLAAAWRRYNMAVAKMTGMILMKTIGTLPPNPHPLVYQNPTSSSDKPANKIAGISQA
jgi:hypothetical protein